MFESIKVLFATSPLPWLLIVLFVGAVLVTAAAFRHGRDETPGGGSFFVNVIWLFLGCGLLVAALLLVVGLVLRAVPGMRDVSRSLQRGVRFVCAPAEFRLRRTRRYSPLTSHYIWLVFGGFWLACLEFALAIAYCCTLVGIYIGRKHLLLARFFLFPCAHRLMTLAEYEDFYAARLQDGR